MNKKFKKFIAALTVFTLMFAVSSPSMAANISNSPSESDTVLQFNDDGKFTIIQFADCQDDVIPAKIMLMLIEEACKEIKPDLVVFSGDNVTQALSFLNKKAITDLIAPLKELGIPFAYTYGNHDAEQDVSKEQQYKHYVAAGDCLTYNADDSIHGFGNCYIPIMSSSDINDMAFNLWIVDSNMYAEEGGYDIVYPDQLEWLKNTSADIKAEHGDVNSLVFQHIIPPEIFEYLKEAPAGTTASTKYHKGYNKTALLEFVDDAILTGDTFLQEFPCPPNSRTGELAALEEIGGVLGVAVGHDHVNQFILSTNYGIDIIQTAGMSYQSYGNDNVRGFRVITLDESDTSTYETQNYLYTDFFTKDIIDANKGLLSGIIDSPQAFITTILNFFLTILNYFHKIVSGDWF